MVKVLSFNMRHNIYVNISFNAAFLISAPKSVDPPEVDAIERGTITLRLHRASEESGPISHYHIVVVPSKNQYKMPADFTPEEVCYLSSSSSSIETG
jgi:hypothetical protein